MAELPTIDTSALIKEQAEANRVTQYTPLGDLRYGTVGQEGQFVPGTSGAATYVDLSPESQNLLDLQNQTSTALGEYGLSSAEGLPGPVDYSGLTPYQSNLDYGSLPGLFGIDFDSFNQVPGSLDSSGFGALPGQIDRSGLPDLTSSLDASGFAQLPEGYDFSGLTALPGIDDFSADAQRVEQSSFERAMGLLNPEFAQQEDRLRQRLANQGIPIEAMAASGNTGEMTRFERNRNEAIQNAAWDAVSKGRQEQSRLFGMAQSARGQQFGEMVQDAAQRFGVHSQQFKEALASAGLGSDARGQMVAEQLQDIATQFGVRSTQFQEALASAGLSQTAYGNDFQEGLAQSDLGYRERQQMLAEQLQAMGLSNEGRLQGINEMAYQRGTQFNELASLLGLSQTQLPQFNAPSSIDVMTPAAMAQQSQLAAYNASQQQDSDMMSGLFGLGSSLIGGLFS